MFCKNCGSEILDGQQVCAHCGTPVEGSAPVAAINSEMPPVYNITSSSRRVANLFIDSIAYYIIFGVIISTLNMSGNLALGDNWGGTGLSFACYIVYYVVMESLFGKTLGKYVTKTKVLMKDGSDPDFMHIVGRTFARFIPFEVFSFFGAYPIGWHDRLSGTVVVEEAKKIN